MGPAGLYLAGVGMTEDEAKTRDTALDGVVAEVTRRLDPNGRNPQPCRGHAGEDQWLDQIPRIECADGLSLSVQTGWTHYCQPRSGHGPWYSVEVGFPSRKIDTLIPFMDGGEGTDPTETVYGYVPIEIVAQAILDAGGLAGPPA